MKMQPKIDTEIFRKLAELLGLPKNCIRATITIGRGQLPHIECSYYVTGMVSKKEDDKAMKVTSDSEKGRLI